MAMDKELLRSAIIDVVKYSVVGSELPADVADVGIRLGRRRATLMDRELEWWIDIPVPLIYLCWWFWKPVASPGVREHIVAARQRVITDHGYDGLALSDELLVTNPLGIVSETALPRYLKLREHMLGMDVEPALSDQLVISNLPFERYVAGEYDRFFGTTLDITKLATDDE